MLLDECCRNAQQPFLRAVRVGDRAADEEVARAPALGHESRNTATGARLGQGEHPALVDQELPELLGERDVAFSVDHVGAQALSDLIGCAARRRFCHLGIVGSTHDLDLDFRKVRPVRNDDPVFLLDAGKRVVHAALGHAEGLEPDLPNRIAHELAETRRDVLFEQGLHLPGNTRQVERRGAVDLHGEPRCRALSVRE